MEIAAYVQALRTHGHALVGAAEAAGLDTPVPTCPTWCVRDLVAHVGGVQRWATSYVRTCDTEPPTRESQAVFFDAPSDDGLLDWFRAGCTELADTLAAADPAMECWSFLRAPSPLAFWARRQAHEAGIHRVDAETARGPVTAFEPEFAADGIDELLCGFLARRRGRLVADPPVTLAVRATDVEAAWTVAVHPDHREVTAGPGGLEGADCLVEGPASDLYLVLWNRAGTEPLDVTGDRSVLELWREKATIFWS